MIHQVSLSLKNGLWSVCTVHDWIICPRHPAFRAGDPHLAFRLWRDGRMRSRKRQAPSPTQKLSCPKRIDLLTFGPSDIFLFGFPFHGHPKRCSPFLGPHRKRLRVFFFEWEALKGNPRSAISVGSCGFLWVPAKKKETPPRGFGEM